jgi:hypothetical protein
MMRDILTIFDAGAYRGEFLFDMWDCVERGDFQDAMNCHFQYMYWKDTYETLVAELNETDKDFLESLKKIADTGK